MKSKLLRAAIHTFITGTCFSISVGAFAQPSNQSSGKNNAAKLQRIQVTGTRIRAASYATAKPVIRISKQDIRNTGQPTLAEALQQLPSIGLSLGNSNGNGNGYAISTINLRGLGAKRSLFLLNGRRFITDPNGNPYVGAIPSSIVDHVDVLKAGASAVYGSDAITGVINVVTVKNFNGAEATARYGEHFGDSHWDGPTQDYSATIGSSGDKWAAVFNVDYKTAGAIPANHRNLTKDPVYGTGNYFGSTVTPQGRFRFFVPPDATIDPTSPNNIPNPAVTGLTSAQCPTMQQVGMYLPTCDLTLKSGQSGMSASDFRQFRTRTPGVVSRSGQVDRFNGQPYKTLLLPYDIKTLYAQGHYDVMPFLSFHATAFYSRKNAFASGAPGGSNFAAYGPARKTNIAPGDVNANISASNPYNPFGIPLDASGDKNTNVTGISRRLSEEGPSRGNILQNTFFFDGGLSGDFTLSDRYFNWDLNYTYGHMDYNDYNSQGHGLYTPLLLDQLNGNLSQCSGKCVPFNLFGGQYHGGTITPAMIKYSEAGGADYRPESQQVIGANITTSDLFDLPAGPLGFALGYEYQERDGQQYSKHGGAFIYNQGNLDDVQGRYHKNAVYGEIKIPLLSDVPLVKHFDVDYAVRYSNYNTFGSSVSNTGGFRWKPTQDLLIRGSIGQGFRAPQINDLYSGQDVYFNPVHDVCDSTNTNRPTTCTAGIDGVPPVPENYQQQTLSTPSVYGSNPNLKAEHSLSKTLGFVYSPAAVPGLSVRSEYWSIVNTNQIGQISAQVRLNQCYLQQDLNRCHEVSRNSDGTITNIQRTLTNRGSVHTDGIDFGFSYAIPYHDLGDFTVNLAYTYVRNYKLTGPNVVNTDGSHSAQNVGFNGYPRHKATLGINWNLGNWAATYRVLYFSQQESDCSFLVNQGFGRFCTNPDYNYVNPNGRRIPTYRLGRAIYNDAQVSYTVSPVNTTFTLGLNNLFGNSPPKYNSTAFYRLPGRYLYARVTARF